MNADVQLNGIKCPRLFLMSILKKLSWVHHNKFKGLKLSSLLKEEAYTHSTEMAHQHPWTSLLSHSGLVPKRHAACPLI